jgi:hypothetical protein
MIFKSWINGKMEQNHWYKIRTDWTKRFNQSPDRWLIIRTNKSNQTVQTYHMTRQWIKIKTNKTKNWLNIRTEKKTDESTHGTSDSTKLVYQNPESPVKTYDYVLANDTTWLDLSDVFISIYPISGLILITYVELKCWT